MSSKERYVGVFSSPDLKKQSQKLIHIVTEGRLFLHRDNFRVNVAKVDSTGIHKEVRLKAQKNIDDTDRNDNSCLKPEKV